MKTIQPKFPVYVISKGRSDRPLTARFLQSDGVEFKIVVEPQEQELYEKAVGKDNVLVLPFSNLGLGSIPARNWVWEHSIKSGNERHWILDDNIRVVYRRFKGIRIPCNSSFAFRAAETFTERYENIAITGLNYKMFVPDRQQYPPFVRNVHVYSCLLIRNDLDCRWRGRYNEDTDLCLQVLSKRLCTVLINVFLIDKMRTMTMKGGNMDQLYQGDGRLKMAKSLERVWPGVVEVRRRFQRPQHVIKYAWARFDTPLILKKNVAIKSGHDEMGMKIVQVKKTVKSKYVRSLIPK